MSDKIVIFGTGAVAFVAYTTFTVDNKLDIYGFTVDNEFLKEDNFLDLPVVDFNDVESIFPPDQYKMIVALGYAKTNRLRAEKYDQAIQKGYELLTVINSTAHTYPDLSIGLNCNIGANVVIHPGVRIGDNVTIRENSFIGHNVEIRNHCFVGAGVVVSGGSVIDEYCLLGVNSTIRDSVRVAKSCVIGAGVTVLRNTNPKEVYIENEAKKFPFSSDDF